MKIAIVDDEIYWRNQIAQEIAKILSDKMITYEVDQFSGGQSLLQEKSYDVIFLDVELEREDGMKIAESYRRNHKHTIIIFITSHSEYIRMGYYVEAFRYIMKEHLHEEILEAMSAIILKLKGNTSVCFHVPGYGDMNIHVNQIYFIETEKRNIRIHLENDSILANNPISEIDTKLAAHDFYRTHKSFLVNLEKIISFDYENVHFANHTTAMLSTRKYNDFKKKFFEYKLLMASQ